MNKTVYLIGAGMGHPDTLTLEAHRAITSSQLLLGAERLLQPFRSLNIPQKPLVLTRDIVEEIHTTTAEVIAVLLSGDPGFYSGAKNLYPALSDCRVITLPGISSVNYFCAKLGIPWQDVCLLSVHGRECPVVAQVQRNRRCLFLTGGKTKVQAVCHMLSQAGFGSLPAHVGECLSYPEERILSATVAELAEQSFPDLAVLLVENPAPISQPAPLAFLRDEDFLRHKVPMTKEEIRLSVLAELALSVDSTVWDVGAGTGSVSIACACTAWQGQVYAVEQKAEAVALMEQNRTRFAADNLHILHGTAPEVLEQLPTPDAVFIGGSSSRMQGIFAHILQRNPTARIVLTCISLESFMDALQCMKDFALPGLRVKQLTVANARTLGSYHMMTGQNPVWVLSAGGRGNENP